MNLAPSEALVRVGAWEQKKSKVSAMILSQASEMVITLNGPVSVREGAIVLTGEGGCELRVTPLETMTLMYADAVLEIRGLGWRCVLYEPRE